MAESRSLIVVAWVDDSHQALACTWLRAGTHKDVFRAMDFLSSQDAAHSAVYTFPRGEKAPLGIARKRVMEAYLGQTQAESELHQLVEAADAIYTGDYLDRKHSH